MRKRICAKIIVKVNDGCCVFRERNPAKRPVFRLLRVIRLLRDGLSGSWETAGMACRALGEGTLLELGNGCWLTTTCSS